MSYFQLEFSKQSVRDRRFQRVVQLEGTTDLYGIDNYEIFKVGIENGKWNVNTVTSFDEQTNFGLDLKRAFHIGGKKHLILAADYGAIQILICENGQFLPPVVEYKLSSDVNWKSVRNNVVFGKFYENLNQIGMMTSEAGTNFKFYEIEVSGERPIVRPIQVDTQVLNEHCLKSSKLMWVELKKNQNELLLCSNPSGMSVFEFGPRFALQFVMKLPIVEKAAKNARIFFPSLSRTDGWNDIVVFNSSGMHVFQHQQNTYKLINYNPMFSAEKKWADYHRETIRFEDVDNDGSDDLIFTGHTGIEILYYNAYANKWKSFLNTENLTPEQRHTNVLHVLSAVDEKFPNAVLVSGHSGMLYFSNFLEVTADVVELPPINREYALPLKHGSPVPAIETKGSDEVRSTLLLRDKNIWLDLLKAVDTATGKPKFVLPLIEDSRSAVKLHLFYDGTNAVDEPLGLGWSMGKNFIASCFQPGSFVEDETYILVVENKPHKLHLISAADSIYEVENTAEDEDNSKIRVKFEKDQSTWQINYGNENTYFYGNFDNGRFGAVTASLGYRNWPAAGSDEFDLERDSVWYLAEVQTAGKSMKYEYVVSGSNEEGNVRTYVKRIWDDENEIRLNYLANSLSNHTRLATYTFLSRIHHQTVVFKYSVVGDSQLLTAIEQEAETVVQFSYSEVSKAKHFLNKIVLPTGVIIDYKYTPLGLPTPITTETSRRFSVSNDFKVNCGLDVILASHLNAAKNEVSLRLYNKEMSQETTFSISTHTSSELGSMLTYQVLLEDSYFAVVVYTKDRKLTFLFGRSEDGTWQTEPKEFSNSPLSVVLGGSSFVLISDPQSRASVVDWCQDKGKWESSLQVDKAGNVRSVAVFKEKFVVYDDVDIFLGYKNAATKKWELQRLLSEPHFLKNTKEVLQKFRLESNVEETIFDFFKNNVIQISHNIIALSKLVIRDNQGLATDIRTFVLGRDHEVAEQQNISVFQDYFDELRSQEQDVSSPSNNISFTMKYSYENNEIILKLASFNSTLKDRSGRLSDSLENSMNKPTAKLFLLDLKNYYVSLQGPTIKCRHTTYSFGGVGWKNLQTEKPHDGTHSSTISLGDVFVLSQNSPSSTIELYNKSSSQLLADLKVKDISQLLINYPVYLAAQEQGKAITLIEFLDGKVQKTTLPKSMQLSPWANAHYLITYENSSEVDKELFVWPMVGVRRLLPNFVIESQNIAILGKSGGPSRRITGYEYKESSSLSTPNGIYYGQSSIFPGKNKKAYGYIRITGHSVDLFNGEDRLVKRNQNKKKQEEKTPSMIANKKDTLLYDPHGRFMIASFFPFAIKSDMAGYIGFEKYENSSRNWMFERRNVIENKFALTGENFLRLQKESMRGLFEPEFQDQRFLVSCWIRTPIEHIPKAGSVVPYLRAIVLTADNRELSTSLSHVKFQIADWSYLETVINLPKNTTTESKQEQFKVDVRVSPSKNIPIDVDNVRFSSLNKIFEVNVYDGQLDKPVAIIASNGAIMRRVYDKYEVQIAEINESNQIKEFRTYTKGAYGGRFGNPKSAIKLIPLKGFYESFAPISFQTRLTISSDEWKISPFTLWHRTPETSHLLLASKDIDSSFFGARFLYSLKGQSLLKIGEVVVLQCKYGKAGIMLAGNESSKQSIPIEGEILLLKNERRVVVWIDGALYIDQHLIDFRSMNFLVEGEVKLQQLMVFSRPQVHVTYMNALDEVIQEVSFSSQDTAVIKGQLYDELGRQRITVQPVEIARSGMESVVSFVGDLVTNGDSDPVWKSGKLNGEISKLIGHKFGFSEISYDNSPLNVKVSVGLPGEKFSSNGALSRATTPLSIDRFLRDRYPSSKNFIYRFSKRPANVQQISVFDENNLKVATYRKTADGRDLFSTFEYNDHGLMIKCLSPMFYAKVGIYKNGDEQTQKKMGIFINYDKDGNAISRTTPDVGTVEYVYDSEEKRLRFVVQHSKNSASAIEFITYFEYDIFGRLSSSGQLNDFKATDDLLQVNITEDNSREFQHFHHSDYERDPSFRGKLMRVKTQNQDGALFEESIHDVDNNVISKRYITSVDNKKPLVLSINNRFVAGRNTEIIYPASMFGIPFRVAYEYDILGRMVSVGIPGQPDRFLKLSYNAADQIQTENFTPHQVGNYTRTFQYNEPGFPVQIDDPFLREEISYTDSGYANNGYADGTVTRIKFTAKWHTLANSHDLGVKLRHLNYNKPCLKDLKEQEYLDKNNQQTRIFYPDLDMNVTFACMENNLGKKVTKTLGKFGYPKEYGFRFDYGSHSELKKAKYFVGQKEPTSLLPSSFQKINGIGTRASKDIWDQLISAGYIGKDGKQKKPLVRETLADDLKSLNPNFQRYTPLFEKLLIAKFVKREKSVSLEAFTKIAKTWLNESASEIARIYDMLLSKKYFLSPLEFDFVISLRNFSSVINGIVGIMQSHFAVEIGKAEYDVESYETDANGNHLKFYAGFEHYQIEYEPNTNRISRVISRNDAEKTANNTFAMVHDSRGNVIKADHKRIVSMTYHPVSNRLERALMRDGSLVSFSYDSKGERAMKRFTNSKGEMISEMHYLRDANGRTLLERKLTKVAAGQAPDVLVTMYVYGPKSLVGFVRRDQFYSVVTDHQGSVRLVIRDGEVVAAYDYMPYGSLMRIYGSNPDAHIPYRFTGQEWDPELDLYNYHARFYDPSIGRFYQIDPATQYFSPYKYADNSPVSMVDPNGEVAVLAILAFAAIGAYWGGATANDNYSPLEWHYNKETFVAMGLGALVGGFFPASLVATTALFSTLSSIAAATLITTAALTSAYLTMAAANRDWNPLRWDYTAPKTWNAAFEGITLGVNILGGLKMAGIMFQHLTTKGKNVFGALSLASGGSSLYLSGSLTQWDIKKPEFWHAAILSTLTGASLPMFLSGGFKSLVLHGTTIRNGIRSFRSTFSNIRSTGTPMLTSVKHAYQISFEFRDAIKSGVLLLLTSSIFGTLSYALNDMGQWDLASLTTYQNLLLSAQLAGYVMILRSKPISTPPVRSQSYDLVMEDIVRLSNKLTQLDAPSPLHIFRGKPSSQSIASHSSRASELVDDVSVYSYDSASYDNPIMKRTRSFRSTDSKNPILILRVPENQSEALFTKLSLSVNQANISLVYIYNQLLSPRVIFNNFNGRDDSFPQRPLSSIHEDPTLVQHIEKTIRDVPRMLEYRNRFLFSNDNILGRLFEEIKTKTSFNRVTIEQCVEAVKKLFVSRSGYVDRIQISSAIRNIHLESEEVEALNQKVQDKEIELSSENKNFLRKKNLEKELKSLKIKASVLLADQTETMVDIFWNKLMEYYNFLVKWEYGLFAETSAEKQSERLTIANPNPYDSSHDLNFLSSLPPEKRTELTTFQSCVTCVTETSGGCNIPTIDPNWLKLMQKQPSEFYLSAHCNENAVVRAITLEEQAKMRVAANLKERRKRSIYEAEDKMVGGDEKSSFVGNKFHQTQSSWFECIAKRFVTARYNETIGSTLNVEAGSNSTWNLLELGDNLLSNFKNNETLLLFQVFMAKYQKRKLFPTSDLSINGASDRFQIQTLSCKVIEIYEDALRISANACGISENQLKTTIGDSFDLYQKIVRIATEKSFEQIFSLLTEYAKSVLDNLRLNDEKREIFLNTFSDLFPKIDGILNDVVLNKKN